MNREETTIQKQRWLCSRVSNSSIFRVEFSLMSCRSECFSLNTRSEQPQTKGTTDHNSCVLSGFVIRLIRFDLRRLFQPFARYAPNIEPRYTWWVAQPLDELSPEEKSL